MPDLMFELGCEEMPAPAAARAGADLAQNIERLLHDQNLTHGPVRYFTTPRRIIVGIADIQARQEDRTERVRGPRIEAAFDSEAKPSRALEGFCRGQGVDPAQVEFQAGYVWASINIAGSTADEILAELLPEAVHAMRFEKSMRWGTSKERFVRPVQWIVAQLGEAPVRFTLFGIASGSRSRGHRFMAPEEFEPHSLDDLLSQLRQRSVEPDPAERRRLILNQIAETGEEAIIDESLLEENVHLVEWPLVHEGSFDEAFLSLPDAVLTTAMVKHQRFFPVVDESGKLTNRFLSVRNNGEESTVRAGNEWVLNARFNDAQFFFNEDAKHSLDDFLNMTEAMVFQPGLGSVRARADRLSELTPFVDHLLGGTASDEARNAGLYAKADLATGLVSELNSLQGVIGGLYAARHGLSMATASAISRQYTLLADPSEDMLATALLIADQMDKLVGFLGLGLIPKGSTDPYGLRRAAGLVIQAALSLANPRFDLRPVVERAIQLYADQSVELNLPAERLAEIFSARLDALLPAISHDVHDAVLAGGGWHRVSNPELYSQRSAIVSELKSAPELVQTFTRPLNILSAARSKNEPFADQFEPALAANETALRLNKALDDPEFDLETPEGLTSHLKWLQGPIHTFFEETMIMDSDLAIRANNLALLLKTESHLLRAGDFSKLIYEDAE